MSEIKNPEREIKPAVVFSEKDFADSGDELDSLDTFGKEREQIEKQAVKLHNTERTLSGRELTEDDAKVNDKFRGDQFEAKISYNEHLKSLDPEKQEIYVEANYACTCPLNENLRGNIEANDEYKAKMTDEQKKAYSELQQKRNEVVEVTKDTIMQKVITENVYKEYMATEQPRDYVVGCANKAEDAAPYTNNIKECYENNRLDYYDSKQGKAPFVEPYENNGDVYIMRFTSTHCPKNRDYPTIEAGNTPPCTDTGFTASKNCLIPEYKYPYKSNITDGAIYKIDHEGSETIVAVWDDDLGRFRPPEEKGDA